MHVSSGTASRTAPLENFRSLRIVSRELRMEDELCTRGDG